MKDSGPSDWHEFKRTLRLVAWQKDHPGYPGEKAELFSATSLESAEIEYLDVIHSLVIAAKPRHALETGTNAGVSAAAIAYGLKRNAELSGQAGLLRTIDNQPTLSLHAKETLVGFGLEKFVEFHVGDSIEVIQRAGWTEPFDLVFFDSTRRARASEFLELKARRLLAPGALLFFHDTSAVRVQDVPHDRRVQSTYVEEVERIARECRGALRLSLSRGLTICQL